MSHVVATIYCNVYRMEFSVKNNSNNNNNILRKTRSPRFNQIFSDKPHRSHKRIHPPIHLRQRTIPPHITQLSSAGMSDRLTTNPLDSYRPDNVFVEILMI